MGTQYETRSYYFMTIAEWFYVDKDYNLQLTELGKQNKDAVKSYNEYLVDIGKKK